MYIVHNTPLSPRHRNDLFSRDCASVCTVTSTLDTLFERWLPSASNSVAKKSRLVKFFPRQKTYWLLLLVEKKGWSTFLCEKSAASPGEANVSATYRYIWCKILVQNIWCNTLVQKTVCKSRVGFRALVI